MIGRYTTLMQKLPRPLGLACKWIMVYPRYRVQRSAARKSFATYGARYRHPLLFVAGMPKSGSTWLGQMIASYPGYREVLLPEASFAELRGESGHLFELPRKGLDRFDGCLVLTKMHCPGSPANVEILREARVPYVVLYRDPRDVAVSYAHYVKTTPWHIDYPAMRHLDVTEGVRFFIRTRLPEFARWMRSWRENRDPGCSLMLSYEEMLDDPRSALLRVFSLFGLEAGEDTVARILEDHRFDAGKAGGGTFFRKGVAGDWRNHFDAELKREFNAEAGDLLVEFGYEKDQAW